MPPDEIEKRSRVQHRGRFSIPNESGHVVEKESTEEVISKQFIETNKSTTFTSSSIFLSASQQKLSERQLSFSDFFDF